MNNTAEDTNPDSLNEKSAEDEALAHKSRLEAQNPSTNEVKVSLPVETPSNEKPPAFEKKTWQAWDIAESNDAKQE